jgi:cytochrome c
MKLIAISLIAVAGLFAGQAMASDEAALALAKKSNCLACHQIDTKLVGPPWKEVSKKYKGDKGAEAMLINRVKNGSIATGGQKWAAITGGVPMPPNGPAVKDEDIKTLVQFVLSLAK